jgi:hypothetical protein
VRGAGYDEHEGEGGLDREHHAHQDASCLAPSRRRLFPLLSRRVDPNQRFASFAIDAVAAAGGRLKEQNKSAPNATFAGISYDGSMATTQRSFYRT